MRLTDTRIWDISISEVKKSDAYRATLFHKKMYVITGFFCILTVFRLVAVSAEDVADGTSVTENVA